MTKDSTDYLVNYAKTLREGGAPHQQELAGHLEAVVDAGPAIAQHAAKDEKIAELETQIVNLKASIGSLMDERDDARAERDEALARVKELEAVAGNVSTKGSFSDITRGVEGAGVAHAGTLGNVSKA